MSDKLTFGELKLGDKFIAFPLPGDDSGHGGYKGGHVLFYKWDNGKNICAKSFTHETLSDIPDTMHVIKIV